MGTMVFFGVLWGIPMYLVDRRARRNKRSPRKRLLIAVLMIWWGLIIPAIVAVTLAGPGEPGWIRDWFSSWLDDDRSNKHRYQDSYHDDLDPWRGEQQRREEDERQAAWAEEDARASRYTPYPDDGYGDR
jgi:hypothetical protein